MSDETLAFKIQQHEGFKAKPYWDPIGKCWTWGYGFTYTTKEEAHIVLLLKLHHIRRELDEKIPFFWRLPDNIQEVLMEMAYQMGIEGLMGFKKMLGYLKEGEYEKAAAEIKDSRLYVQTPKRAKHYMKGIVK